MILRKSKIVFTTLVLFAIGLLVGLLFSFPQTKVKQTLVAFIESQGHVVIEKGDVSISLFGIKGSNLLVQPLDQLWPPLPIKHLNITPQWLSLLSKNPGVHVDTQLFNGTLTADLHRDGSLNLEAAQLDLAFLSPEDQITTLTGQLADLTLTTVVPIRRASESLLTLALKNVNVSRNGDLKLKVNLGDIIINATGRGRSFKILSLKAEKGDLVMTGAGSILLGKDMSSTKVNLKMEVQPEATVDPMVAELLKLSGRETANGSYDLNLSGSLPQL